MKYDELDERAKDRARDKWAEGVGQDEWWDVIYEDVVACGKILGIDIDEEDKGRHGYKIYFNGFYVQSSGAGFHGRITLNDDSATAVERMKAHAPLDEDLMRIAGYVETAWTKYCTEFMKRLLRDENDTAMMRTTFIDVSCEERYGYRMQLDNNIEDDECIVEDVKEIATEFAEWIYSQLEAEYEYQTSTEAIEESIRANEPDFDEEGNL